MKIRRITFGIGLKLIAGFLTIVMLIAVVAYVAVQISEEALQETIGENAQRLARKTMQEIDEAIYFRYEEMRVYADAAALAEEARRSNESYDTLANVRAFIDTTDRDWKAGKNTPVIEAILGSDLSDALRRYLRFYEQRYGYAVLAEMYVANKYGVVIGSTGRTSDYLQADEGWYQKAVAEEDFWVGDVEYDESSDTFAIDIVANLHDEDGNFAGIFKGVLNVEDIKITITRMQARSPFESMTPYLVNSNGLVLFSGLDPDQKPYGRDAKIHEFGEDVSHRRSVAQAIDGKDGFLVSVEKRHGGDAGLHEVGEDVSHRGSAAQAIDGKDGFPVSAEVRPTGEEKLLSAFSPSSGFREFKGLGWALIVEYETGEILGPVTKVKNFLLLISLISVVVALAVAVFVARSISIPIRRLTEAAEGISTGDMDARIDEVEGRDETGRLATAFNRMGAKLKKSHEGLEQRVRERTAELEQTKSGLEIEIGQRRRAEETLARQARELARSNQELQQFAYAASHDLQEPLRKVSAFGDLLVTSEAEGLTERGRDYLRRMRDAATRMKTLINDILRLSRITTQAQPFVAVDLSKVAREVVADLEVRIEETGGRVDVMDIPTIEADPIQMRQLIQNLIGNALKFHRSGEAPVVTVRGSLLNGQTNGVHPEEETLRLTVEDNGIGFDETYLDRIFTVFQRLHGRGEYDGSGVGLAVCRKIVQRHSGTITARSEPGRGSTFVTTLPVNQRPIDHSDEEELPWTETEDQSPY